MYVIDCGANASTIYDANTDQVEKINHKEVLKLPDKLPSGSYVVSEYSHLGCARQKLSRSQPFTEDELYQLYKDFKDNNITLKLFPPKSTPTALSYAKLTKSDTDDPKAIYLFLKNHPRTCLMNPPKNLGISTLRQEVYDFKHTTNEILNVARRYEYLDEEDCNSKFIKKHIEEIIDNISDITKSVFGLDDCRYGKSIKKRNIKKGDINFNKINMIQFYSIVAILQDTDGTLRLRTKTNKLPGWKFVKQFILGMSPFHLKGGVARSNLYWHGFRNWTISQISKETGLKKEKIRRKRKYGGKDSNGNEREPFTSQEHELFLKCRKQYNAAMKELYMVCKKILIRENFGDLATHSNTIGI